MPVHTVRKGCMSAHLQEDWRCAARSLRCDPRLHQGSQAVRIEPEQALVQWN